MRYPPFEQTGARLSPSAKQRRNPCYRRPSVYQDLGTRYDWPVKKFIANLPIRLKEKSKYTSSNSLSPLGGENKISALHRRRYQQGLDYVCDVG